MPPATVTAPTLTVVTLTVAPRGVLPRTCSSSRFHFGFQKARTTELGRNAPQIAMRYELGHDADGDFRYRLRTDIEPQRRMHFR